MVGLINVLRGFVAVVKEVFGGVYRGCGDSEVIFTFNVLYYVFDI